MRCDGLGLDERVVQRRNRLGATALRSDAASGFFAAAALRGHAQFQLDLVKTQTGARVACDFPIRNATADTDDHGLA